jgi:hypothetical protein
VRARNSSMLRQRDALDGTFDVSNSSCSRRCVASHDANLVGIETLIGAFAQLDFHSVAGPQIAGRVVTPLSHYTRAAEMACAFALKIALGRS